jgi:integrase
MTIKKVKSKKYKSGYGWQVIIQRRGLPRLRQTFETPRLAQDIHDAILGDYARRKFNLPVESRVTLDELVEKHIATIKKRGRATKRAETVLERFAGIAGSSRMVETIRTADLQEYADSRLDDGLKPQSVNREMNEIKSCLTNAAKYYRSLEDYRSPRAPWLPEPSDGRRQTWSDEDIALVLQQLYQPKRAREKDEHVQGRHSVGDMFIIALQTGLRAGEVRKLRKSDIDFNKREIRVTSKKGMSDKRAARPREVPMTDKVCEILSRRFTNAKGQYLFPGNDPQKPLSDHRKAFITACKRAGIPYGLNGDGSLIFNDARRTAENRMLDAGHSPRAVGDIQGHSAETMAKHYARSTRESRQAAIESTRYSGEILVNSAAQSASTAQSARKAKSKKAS